MATVSDYVAAQLRAYAADLRAGTLRPAPFRFGYQVDPDWQAKLAADRAARRAVAAERHAQAVAAWELVRSRVPSGTAGAVLLELLDLHKPVYSDFADVPNCDHCLDNIGYEVGSMEWPCETYATIEEGLADAHDC